MRDNHEFNYPSTSNANLINTEVDDSADDLCLSNVTQLYLKLECQFLIPASTIQHIVSGEYSNYNESQDVIKRKLNARLIEKGMSPEMSNQIIDDVFKSYMFSKSHNLLGTDYKREKFYKAHFNYEKPQAKLLGTINGKKKMFSLRTNGTNNPVFI